ncbi:transporter substrate-binding domain-containing protein [Parachlamydia sp. AcF125]|uniref:substrate-binding periplasmic protein n=1 Tax=Parachlamydia sp. AcF125 TaxID=2795736 RepID=UPI001BC927A5|nr:transporter substrate-binding domain-containing protein [Parachlamydia sp. AcF125]MBS4167424.1 Arginine-binding extracellular protein ArtP [Parachlamydia sp. AcF125]
MKRFKLFNSPLPEIKPTGRKFLVFIAVLIGLAYFFFSGNQSHRSLEYKVFRIGRDPTWYPLQLQGNEKKMVAFTNELLLAVAKESGFHFEISDVHSHTLFENLEKGDYDAVLSPLMPNQFNRQKYEFSALFFSVGPVLVVAQDSSAKSLADMEGKIVGVQRGTSLVSNMAQYPSMIAPYDQITFAFDQLLQDKIDGVVTDLFTAHTYAQGYYAKQLKLIPPPLTNEGLRLVAKQGIAQSYLLTRFNEGLKKVKEKGDYQKLLTKWGLAQI